MATQTTHFDMVKQQSPERVSVGLLNDNFDIIDGVMFANQEKSEQLADDYNASETYNTGDYVRRENYLYKCKTDNTTGTWDVTKWDRVKVMEEITQGGGGGSSTLAGLNDVDLSSPTDGQVLGYNGTTNKWENVTGGGGGGSSTFAGLNDVNVTGVQNGDIARYNSATGKWTKSSDLTDLELSVSQLSSSVLNIAGDVDALELTVNQMSASTLPYDANISTKQKIDNVESSIPTSASDLPYDNTQSGLTADDVQGAIDELNAVESDAITRVGAYIVATSNIKKYGKIVIAEVFFSSGESYTELPSQTYVTIGTIPAKYRPNSEIYNILLFCSPQTKQPVNQVQVRVYPNGDVKAYNYFEQMRVSGQVELMWIK